MPAIKLLFVFVLFYSISYSHAKMGNEGVGGGDICEDRIKIIRDDLIEWIKNGGGKTLALPRGFNLKNYSEVMLKKMKNAHLSCATEKDQNFPLEIEGTPKTCLFKSFPESENNNEIICDFYKFQSMNEADQYTLIHHEFAGLAGVEIPKGSDSNYFVSNQLADYFSYRDSFKLLLFPTLESQNEDGDYLKKEVLAEVLKEINNPRSNLGNGIAKINEQTPMAQDKILFPIRGKNFQIVFLKERNLKNKNKQILSEDNKQCLSFNEPSTFLFILKSKSYNEDSAYQFKVEAQYSFSRSRKDARVIMNCESIFDDDQRLYFSPVKKLILKSGPIKNIETD